MQIFEDTKKKERLKYSAISVLICFISAHAFTFFNYMPVHDEVNYFSQFAASREYSLGRFLQPLYGAIRGRENMPWLTAMLAMIYLILMLYLITKLLDIDSPAYIMLSGIFLCINISIIDVIYRFSYLIDAFMLSMLLSTVGVYFLYCVGDLKGFLLSIPAFVASMGFYLSFITTAVVLVALIVIKELMLGKRFEKLAKELVISIASVFFSFIIFMLLSKIIMRVTGTTANSGNYNSLASVINVAGIGEYAARFKKIYIDFFTMFFNTGYPLQRICNLVILLLTLMLLIVLLRDCKPDAWRIALIAVILMISPVLGEAPSIELDIGYSLKDAYRLINSVFLLYLLPLCFVEWKRKYIDRGIDTKDTSFTAIKYVLVASMLIWGVKSVVFSNGVYSFKAVLFQRATFLANTVINDIQKNDEYEHGATEVVLIGDPNSAEVFNDEIPLRYVETMEYYNSSLTYPQVFGSMTALLRTRANVVIEDPDVTDAYMENPEVLDMPVYPKDGYCRIVDGRMVVKFPE